MLMDDLPRTQGRTKEMSAIAKIVMFFSAAMLVNVTWGLWKDWTWPDYATSATITGVYVLLMSCFWKCHDRQKLSGFVMPRDGEYPRHESR